jgi:alpha-beta hydrolase superfamily lysophospholipase
MRTWAAIVLVALLGGCNLQRSMLYHPGGYSLEGVRAQAGQAGLRLWPAADAGYLGLLAEPAGEVRGTVVVFHGNAGTAGFRSYYAEALLPLGWRVILAEYPGYGGRPGELSEPSFARDAARVLARAEEDFGTPLVAWGESLGAAVIASALAADAPAPAGVVMLTPWDTLHNAARAAFPFLPVGLFLSDRYDSVGNLRDYPGPVAVVVAEADEVVPVRLGRALHAGLPEPNRLWVMPGVGHNDWNIRADNPMWREVMGWLEAEGR